MAPEKSVIPEGWAARIIARSGSQYMILLRPGERIDLKEARIDDVAIIADATKMSRRPPWFLQLYLKFSCDWDNCKHDATLLEELLAFDETPREPQYQEHFASIQKSLQSAQERYADEKRRNN